MIKRWLLSISIVCLTALFIVNVGNVAADTTITIEFTSRWEGAGTADKLYRSGGDLYVFEENTVTILQVINEGLQPVGQLTHPQIGKVIDATRRGNYLYVVANPLIDNSPEATDVSIIDVSDRAYPRYVAGFDLRDGGATGVVYKDDHLLISGLPTPLYVVDVRDKANPQEVWVNTCPDETPACGVGINTYDIELSGNYAYVAGDRNGLQIFDVSDPSDPELVSQVSIWGARGVAVAGNMVYVDGANDDGLVVVDASDPLNPRTMSRLGGNWTLTAVENGFVYVLGRESFGLSGGMALIDVRNPSNPIGNVAGIDGDIKIAAVDFQFIYAAVNNGIEMHKVSHTSVDQPVEGEGSGDNWCPQSGAWPAGCTPRPENDPTPDEPDDESGNNWCPQSGPWPAGCTPRPANDPTPDEPDDESGNNWCPQSGPWPAGCTPRPANDPTPDEPDDESGNNWCPQSGPWPAGCTPRPANDPTPTPPSGEGEPCPPSGPWPAGCVPSSY